MTTLMDDKTPITTTLIETKELQHLLFIEKCYKTQFKDQKNKADIIKKIKETEFTFIVENQKSWVIIIICLFCIGLCIGSLIIAFNIVWNYVGPIIGFLCIPLCIEFIKKDKVLKQKINTKEIKDIEDSIYNKQDSSRLTEEYSINKIQTTVQQQQQQQQQQQINITASITPTPPPPLPVSTQANATIQINTSSLLNNLSSFFSKIIGWVSWLFGKPIGWVWNSLIEILNSIKNYLWNFIIHNIRGSLIFIWLIICIRIPYVIAPKKSTTIIIEYIGASFVCVFLPGLLFCFGISLLVKAYKNTDSSDKAGPGYKFILLSIAIFFIFWLYTDITWGQIFIAFIDLLAWGGILIVVILFVSFLSWFTKRYNDKQQQ